MDLILARDVGKAFNGCDNTIVANRCLIARLSPAGELNSYMDLAERLRYPASGQNRCPEYETIDAWGRLVMNGSTWACCPR